jgi:hypothetical protein
MGTGRKRKFALLDTRTQPRHPQTGNKKASLTAGVNEPDSSSTKDLVQSQRRTWGATDIS